MTIATMGIVDRSSSLRSATRGNCSCVWWLEEFADQDETSTSPDARQHTHADTNALLYPEECNVRMRKRLAELGDGRCFAVVTTSCAAGFPRVSAFSLLQGRRRICQPELLSFPWSTGPGSLTEYPVPRSFRLVVVECVRRAIDGLSPLSGPSGA